MPAETTVASFVVRFVHEASDLDDDTPDREWRGVIKHVQTDDEQHFTRLADALAFMARFVNLDAFTDRDSVHPTPMRR